MTDDSGHDEATRISKALKDYEPYEEEPKLNRIADMVDNLAAEMRNEMSDLKPSKMLSWIKQIEAIQTAIYRP